MAQNATNRRRARKWGRKSLWFLKLKSIHSLETISNYDRLKRVTAWMLHFIYNCRARAATKEPHTGALTTAELHSAEVHWLASAQALDFPEEISVLRRGDGLTKGTLLSLNPFLDSQGLLRVGGRQALSQQHYHQRHPIILSGKNKLTKLILQDEHLRLLDAGPTLMAGSLARRFHILGARRAIRAITRGCVNCRRVAGKHVLSCWDNCLQIERVLDSYLIE